MKKAYRIILLFILILSFVLTPTISTAGNEKEISTYSPHVLLIESTTGKTIYEKDADAIVSPASTTKIMTAILTLENCELTDKATVSHNAIYSVPIGYSHAYLVEGEELTIDELLHVLLIPSANDAANVLAEHISGSVDSFSTMMNTRAKELGCTNTHFVNPNGIQEDNHYTTAHDLAIMARYAMQNETFRKIVATKSYTLPATNKYTESNRFFETTNQLIVPDDRDSVDNYYYKYANGIKTGYTDEAGECIVASAKKDDKEFIAVILGGESTENGLSGRFIDCKNLFNYAFENYKTYTINEKNAVLKEVKVSNAPILNTHLDLIVEDEITLLLKNTTDTSSITPVINITSDLVAPISKNSTIGTITYEVDGNTYTSNLLAGRDISESSFITNILSFGSILVFLYFLYKLLSGNKKKNKKRKKKTTTKRNDYMYW